MRERTPIATRASRTAGGEAAAGRSIRRGVTVATIAAFLMAFSGAFETAEIPLLPRLGYWLVIMEAGALLGIGVSTAVDQWGRLEPRPVAEGALISLCIALPLTLVVLGTTALFFGGRTPSLQHLAVLFAMVFVVTATITAINYAVAGPAPAAAPVPPPAPMESPAPAEPARPRLAERLPRHLRDAPIHAVQAEDHYLRVHTAAGSDLILLRMGDALAELDGIEGTRTHRSWWVARAAVESATTRDGRAELTLPGELTAPVSRSYYPALRDAGWFD